MNFIFIFSFASVRVIDEMSGIKKDVSRRGLVKDNLTFPSADTMEDD